MKVNKLQHCLTEAPVAVVGVVGVVTLVEDVVRVARVVDNPTRMANPAEAVAVDKIVVAAKVEVKVPILVIRDLGMLMGLHLKFV